MKNLTQLIFFLFLEFFFTSAYAIPNIKLSQTTATNTILQADEIDGDSENNILNAVGNVEVTRDNSTIYADKISYYQNDKMIHASGNLHLKNIEVGNMFASKAKIKDDFSSGEFLDGSIVFKDGSYLKSEEVKRETINKTKLFNSFFSFCPNEEIALDNKKAGQESDMLVIETTYTEIDRDDNMMRSKNGVLKIYEIPVLYTPYIAIALPSKERQSGFLSPSYLRTTNFGLGVQIPYYFNIAKNIDLTTSPQISLTNNQIIIDNDFRHLTSYGQYNLNFELANNELKESRVNSAVLTNETSGIANKEDKNLRWNLKGNGKFDFSKNFGANFDINAVSDINYFRDYDFNYVAYTKSLANLDYIYKRNYYSVKTIQFQELENELLKDEQQIILPEINTYNESEKSLFYKEKYALTTNLTIINRDSGLQYRRASFVPEISVPLSLKGNLFDLNAKLQGDFYYLENNFKNRQVDNSYKSNFANYKPEVSLSWRLPLIQKTSYNTLIIEPIVNVVSSSFHRNNNKTVNEDSAAAELSISNLFVSNRISGFDRNESGERVNYGLKTSSFNNLGEFGLIFGQSHRFNSVNQDIAIDGFAKSDNSNFVGQAFYKTEKYFNINYAFQLNENNYRNEINQVATSLNFKKFSISSSYLMLRRNLQNLEKKEQVTVSSNFNFYKNWNAKISFNRDIQLNRTISRGIVISRDGCCTIFGFAVTETNPGSLIKPQRSFSLNFTFKNL